MMIWNNGDGDDVNDGGDGADETQFNNGTADDVMCVAPLAGTPGAHRFNRVGAAIEIDIAASTERLNINAFSGADIAHQRRRHDAPDDDRRRPRQRHHHHR